MAKNKKDPPGAQDDDQDSDANPESTPPIPEPERPEFFPTSINKWDPETESWLTSTALVEVFDPNAAYNADVENIAEIVKPNISYVLSAKTFKELYLKNRDDLIKYYFKYRGHAESKQFFLGIRDWVHYLCAGRPDIPYPPSESEPENWGKWIEDNRPEIAEADEEEKIKVDLNLFKNGKARRFLENLLNDNSREGVKITKKDGTRPVAVLKEALKSKENKPGDLTKIADAIVHVKGKIGTYKLSIPPGQIRVIPVNP